MGPIDDKEKDFFKYVKEGNITEVKHLIKEVRVDCCEEQVMTPLMHASYKGDEEMVALLIENGANVNADTQKDGYTPLMFATLSGSTDTVRLLLEQGAKPNALNKINKTAAQLGAFVGRHDCVSVINNYVEKEQIQYYTKRQGLEDVAKLPEYLSSILHKYIIIPILNPVKLVLFIDENKVLLKHDKSVINVLDSECTKAYKNVNEVLSLKCHVFLHVFKQCVAWENKDKGKDGLKNFLKFLLRAREEDGFQINIENLLRESFKSFPYPQSNVFNQIIRSVARVTPGDSPTSLTSLTQAINGMRSTDFSECCVCCGERHSMKKCSACKMVRYCTERCQKLHWFSHKKFCKDLQKQYLELKEYEEKMKKEEEEEKKLAENKMEELKVNGEDNVHRVSTEEIRKDENKKTLTPNKVEELQTNGSDNNDKVINNELANDNNNEISYTKET